MSRSISVKRPLIEKMNTHFPTFTWEGESNGFFAFIRNNENGLYDHIIFQREFDKNSNTGSLTISEAASCYNQSWKGIPWCIMGKSTSLGALITGKSRYDTNLGWHTYENTKDGLALALEKIEQAMLHHMLPYFEQCHQELGKDKIMQATHRCMRELLPQMTQVQVLSLKQWLKDCNAAYSQQRKKDRQQTLSNESSIDYFSVIPEHPFFEECICQITSTLSHPQINDSIRKKLVLYINILFRDLYNFYNLQ